jgi:tripartite-type tricarboxylate transporter receptor subunit TctC
MMGKLLLLVLGLASLAGPAPAQDYPTRPVRAIVAVGAGGTGDVVTRVLGEELYRRWGQPVVVENRPGGAYRRPRLRRCAARRLHALHHARRAAGL